MQLNDALIASYAGRNSRDVNAFGVNNDLGLVNKTDDVHFPGALGAEERICFVHLSDEVRPALF